MAQGGAPASLADLPDANLTGPAMR